MTPDFGEGITIEARVRFDQFRSWSRIIDLCDSATAKTILLANKEDSRRLIFQVHRGGGVVSSLEASTDLPQGQWVHVAATIERDGQGHLYVDGVEVATGKMDLPERVERVNNYLGKGSWGNPIFQGEMDAVRLYTYALSSQEVKGLMQGSFERAVICAEYSRVRVDAQRRKSVMMLRCLALAHARRAAAGRRAAHRRAGDAVDRQRPDQAHADRLHRGRAAAAQRKPDRRAGLQRRHRRWS